MYDFTKPKFWRNVFNEKLTPGIAFVYIIIGLLVVVALIEMVFGVRITLRGR